MRKLLSFYIVHRYFFQKSTIYPLHKKNPPLLLLLVKRFNIEHSEYITGGNYATTSFFYFS
ncbi:hypothetical protein B7H16_08870 [Anoxybacillus ayderensis]|nr:hypothetical protein B7H16_08870 [Anoxybacillus ayderensis]